MGLQHPEAFDEYILFVVTDRGEGLAVTGWWCPRWVPCVVATLRRLGWHRTECAAADPPGIRPGRGCRDRAPGHQLHLLVSPCGLEPTPQVRQRALCHRPLQPGQATPGATSLSPPLIPCPRAVSLCSVPLPRCSLTTSRDCSLSCHPPGRESSTSLTWPSWPPSSIEPRTVTTSPPCIARGRGSGGVHMCGAHWTMLDLTSVSLQAGGAGLCPPTTLPPAEGSVLAAHGDPTRAAGAGAQCPPGTGAVPG